MSAASEIGSGDYRYRQVEGWARLPDRLKMGEVAAVGVDGNDQVYVFNRGPHPMLVFDREGTFLRSWGEGLFSRPHGISIAPDGSLFCTDDGDHTARRCTPEGKVLLTLGVAGRPSAAHSGLPFCRCTHTAHAPNGDIYVSDGYGNARVHKFDPKGRHLLSWGEPGTGPGQFNLPHNIACDEDGIVHVADRENHRIQLFDGQGKFVSQWHDLHRPSALCLSAGPCPTCIVGELGPYLTANRGWPDVGPRLSVMSREGEVLARLAGSPSAGAGPGQFVSPHGIAVDSRGDIYVGEVAQTGWPSLFPGAPAPPGLDCLKKFARLSRVDAETEATAREE